MKKLLVAFGLILLASGAFAQSVQQSGSITPTHVPSWVTNGVIGDGGTAADSPVSTFGVTSNTTAGICVSSGRATAAGRQQICLGAPLNSSAIISVQNYGTATAQGLGFNINGSIITLPSGGGDFITGTGPYVAGGVPCFTGTTSAVTNCGLTLSGGTITAGNWAGTPIPLTFGGTGAISAAAARTNLGLGTLATQNASAVAITGGTITGMPSPSGSTDVVNKAYVDAFAAGIIVLPPSTLATAAVLPNTPTYSNGALGVGATLTAGSNTTLTVDATAAPLNTVVLVKNQASAFQNGIYTVTAAGDGSNPWVLTRATYFDQAAEMHAGSSTFISAGATNINTSYALQTTVTTVGTDPLTWNLYSTSTASVTSIAGNTGAFTLSGGVTNTVNAIQLDGNYGGFANQNCTLAVSASASALTIALKDNAGNDPSATSPCIVNFRNATGSVGSTTLIKVTAATSMVVSSGSTLGVTSARAFRLWVVGFNDAGTFRLGVINPTAANRVVPLNEWQGVSSTAEGGSGGADNAGIFYTATAVSAKMFKIMGFAEWAAGGVTAGAWELSNYLTTQTYGPGVKKPGEVVQAAYLNDATGSSTTSTSPIDVTGSSVIMTPSSAANRIRYSYSYAVSIAAVAGVNTINTVTCVRTSTALNGIRFQSPTASGGTGHYSSGSCLGLDSPNTTSALTYKIQQQSNSASALAAVDDIGAEIAEIMQ